MIEYTLSDDCFMFTAMRSANEHQIKELEHENRKILEAINSLPEHITLEVSKHIDDLKFYYAKNVKAIELLKEG